MSTVTVTAADINKLRKQTGAGMMDCRKALIESDGDFEAAIDYLRKKGQKVAALRSDREANEGVIIAQTTSDNKVGYVLNLSCETDFVSKNEDFIKFAQAIMDTAIANNPADVNALKALKNEGESETIKEQLEALVGKIGENISLSTFKKLEAPYVAAYIHGANRMGVLVGLSEENEEVGKDLAMQIAAMNPLAVDKDSVPADIVAREKDIAVEQVKASGKPADLAEKIALGKLNKFFKENTLLQQEYIKDSSQTVEQFIKAAAPNLKVTQYERVALGA